MSASSDDAFDDSAPTLAPANPPAIGRYRLIREIGAGGMGRVYLAYDQDLGEQVALKVIRADFASADAEERFKREITVARRVTHRNVIRVHDTGVADGARYISMPFIDGEDLASIARRGVLPLDSTVETIVQVCDGLAAAHEAGVVHRDLKPANIMLGRDGRAYVMDFGLARAVEVPALSAPGMMIGTADYMSPEQVRGEPADERSDVYAVGVILFQLLTGRLPFEGDTAVSRLTVRLHRDALDIAAIQQGVPSGIADVVRRCLARDPASRYQRASDVRDALMLTRHVASIPKAPYVSRRTLALVGVVLLVATAAGTQFGWRRFSRSGVAAPVRPIVLAALPLHNASGDPTINWYGSALPDVVLARLAEVDGVRVMPRDRVVGLLGDLHVQPSEVTTDETVARVHEFTNADVVVSGRYMRGTTGIRIEISLSRADGRSRMSFQNQSAGVDEIDDLGEELASALSMSLERPLPKRVTTLQKRTPSVTRLFREGVELSRDGKYSEAAQRLAAATVADDRFAEAWAALAATYAELHQDRDAARASRRSVDVAEGISPRDRFRILALHANIQQDNRQAIEVHEQWLKAAPNDLEARFALANLLESTGAYDAGKQQFREVLTQDPLHVQALLGVARNTIRGGAPADAIEPLTLALSVAVRLDNDKQRAAAYQALGIAYKRLNRPVDALPEYQHALELNRRLGSKGAEAASLGEIAQVYEKLGKPADAERHYVETLKIFRDIGDRAGAGSTLINLGDFYAVRGAIPKAIEMANEALRTAHDMGNEAREALCLNNLGSAYMGLGEFPTARLFLDRSLAMSRRLNLPTNTADSIHNLGEIAAATGDYPAAIRHVTEALEIRRRQQDTTGASHEHYQLSLIYLENGRLGAAAAASQQALSAARPNEDPWYPEMRAFAAVGRASVGDCRDFKDTFDAPLTIARNAADPRAVTRVLNAQSTVAWICGDLTVATHAADEAVAIASQSSHAVVMLDALLHQARVQNVAAHSLEAIAIASKIVAKAERIGARPTAADALIELAEALNARREFAKARQSAERALAIADKTGSWLQLSRANYFLAQALRGLGQATEAVKSFEEAKRWVKEIQREAGTHDVLARPDLRRIEGQ